MSQSISLPASCTAAAGEAGAGGGAPRWAALLRWVRGPWLAVLALTLGTLVLHSRHNEFPFYYEKDAGSKVAQVLSGQRNFFHPMLMLNATDLGMRLTGAPRTEEDAARVGH